MKNARPVCRFCAQKTLYIDYKNVRVLRRYVQSSARIQPSRYAGTCAAHHRSLTTAIKQARMIALLPFVR